MVKVKINVAYAIWRAGGAHACCGQRVMNVACMIRARLCVESDKFGRDPGLILMHGPCP